MKIPSPILFLLTLTTAISITPDSFAQVAEAIIPSFDVNQAVKRLEHYANLQKQLNIQNPGSAYGMRKALVIADLLITAEGNLRAELCQEIKAAFIPSQPQEYEVNLGRILDQMDVTWQAFIDRIEAPRDSACVSNTTLRALFSLGSSNRITDRHAKVAVLAALFAPESEHSFGASGNVLRSHEEFFRHAAADYAMLVKKGFLKRPVRKGSGEFFYLPNLADPDRNLHFDLDVAGTFARTEISLFDAPGFAAARDLMGGDEISCPTQDVMKVLLEGLGQDPIHVTPAEVIHAMAKIICAKGASMSIAALSDLGAYAFSSLTSNPLLCAAQAVFAGMAEERDAHSTRSRINDCVAQAMEPAWSQVKEARGVVPFQRMFADLFNDSYRLIYNLNIPLPEGEDKGAQLFKRAPLGSRVATPAQFRQLAIDAILETEARLDPMIEARAIANYLIDYVSTDAFLTNALWAYDRANRWEADPIQNYHTLVRTPMQSCDGDHPYQPNVQTLKSKNVNDLISWCMDKAKIVHAQRVFIDTPQHALHFMEKDSDLARFIASDGTISEWLQKTVIVPGMQVAMRQIDATTQIAISQALYAFFSGLLPERCVYDHMVEKLSRTKMSVKTYSQKLLAGITQLLNGDQTEEIATALDAVLLQHLPSIDRMILEQGAIRFAFANRNDAFKNIFFCAYFNPRTAQIAFGTIFEDKTNLQPLEENGWIKKLF